MMKHVSDKLTLCSLSMVVLLSIAGCSVSEEVRIDASGTVNLDGRPVQSGTLVLTPKVNGQMPVASRIESGHFVFDAETGPLPGDYVARVNPDEATIEEISAAAAEDPRGAAKQFHANRTASPSGGAASKREAVIVIGDVPGQKVTIDL